MSEETTTAPQEAVVTRPPAIVLGERDLPAYEALQNAAVIFDLAPRHISAFNGDKAAESLNGLVSNDLLPLAVGKGVYAAALTPKGKMLADVSILRTAPTTFLVETSETAGRDWYAMVRKYVNPRVAKYTDESNAYSALAVYGPSAPALIARLGTGGPGDQEITNAMEAGLRAWPNWAHANFSISGIPVRLVRAPYLGVLAGFEILVDSASRDKVILNLERVGAISGSNTLWQLAQLEGGHPVLSLDMDANTIPQEANLDDWAAISYEKGCYTGQETVARIHFRGHVNKRLCGLVSDSQLDPGTDLRDSNGKAVGEIRRSGHSPRWGSIAIAMVRREIAAGATVTVGGTGDQTAVVMALTPDAQKTWSADAKRGAP